MSYDGWKGAKNWLCGNSSALKAVTLEYLLISTYSLGEVTFLHFLFSDGIRLGMVACLQRTEWKTVFKNKNYPWNNSYHALQWNHFLHLFISRFIHVFLLANTLLSFVMPHYSFTLPHVNSMTFTVLVLHYLFIVIAGFDISPGFDIHQPGMSWMIAMHTIWFSCNDVYNAWWAW